ncbi:MAG TPA: glycosyltransferase [Actinomycetota bacterium]|nr:glycosyltransferase [Actinomycetota bacterium]
MREERDPFGMHPSPRARSVERVALLSVHTCPLDQPGTGDSGGMNVVIRHVARRMAEMGIAVDIFSRWAGAADRIREMDPGVRVIHLEAGPDHAIPKEQLGEHLGQFVYSLLQFESQEAQRLGIVSPLYDAVHSHYWLSGRVGRLVSERWGVPLIQSFHTLGRVKNRMLSPGDAPEPATRIAAEERIAQTAHRVLAPTAEEAHELIAHYGAPAERVSVLPPGVDTDLFRPDPDGRAAAKAALGFGGRTLVLFVGRLQPLKAPEIAVGTIAALARLAPHLDAHLLIIGGPSGGTGIQPAHLEKLAAELGVADRVHVRAPVPHMQMPEFYRAADITLVPSRSESFGLVALEASACGTPVVATDVGGLRTAIRDGITGSLVPEIDAAAFASAVQAILADPARARAMGEAGARFAKRYDWRHAAASLLEVYEDERARLTDTGD